MLAKTAPADGPMTDAFGRSIEYARISLTDRCDLRCRYCMAEHMQFLPKRDIMTLEEIEKLCAILVGRGVKRIRLTGGEPLVRRGVTDLAHAIGRHLGQGLDELTLTTNGNHLERLAGELAAAGIRRINVSLDSLQADRFHHVTRGGDLRRVMRGIDAALAASLQVKINMVALAGINADEIEDMLVWCSAKTMDLTLIETMPLGEVEGDRMDHYLPLDVVKQRMAGRFTLAPSLRRTGGPARYYDVVELGTRIGFITPLSANFCAGCNRIRVAATGTAYGCLGHDQKVELREGLRRGGEAEVDRLLGELVAGKPKRHDFRIEAPEPALARHMNVTGG